MIARLLCVTLLALPQAAATRPDASLKDLHTVSVAVDPIAPAAVRLGVTNDAIRADVEQGLKGAAIRVNAAEHVQLTVTINAVPIETNRRSTSGIAYTVALSIDQEAILQRTGASVKAATWRRAGIGVSQSARANEAIREQLRDYVNAFVSAWKAANGPLG